MAHAFTPGLAASERTLVRRVRELPVAGEVLRKIGDVVAGDEIVARAYLPGDLHILRIAERLSIQPAEVVKGLKVDEGAPVQAGDLLCEHRGLFGLFCSRFEAPCSGSVEFVAARTGHVGVRAAAKPLQLAAYLSGRVVAVEPERSLTIESEAAFLQGIFGVGGERLGKLRKLPAAEGEQVDIDHIPGDCAGAVLFGGMRPTAAALQKARDAGARGFITGSIDDHALRAYLGYDLGIALTGDEAVTMSVIVTEGFGSIPMSARACGLLAHLEGRMAAINGATQVRAGALRPEVIIFHALPAAAAEALNPTNATGLQVGSPVRMIRVPYFGATGRVVELPSALEVIGTGAHARVLRARLDDSGQVVTVPRANVELL